MEVQMFHLITWILSFQVSFSITEPKIIISPSSINYFDESAAAITVASGTEVKVTCISPWIIIVSLTCDTLKVEVYAKEMTVSFIANKLINNKTCQCMFHHGISGFSTYAHKTIFVEDSLLIEENTTPADSNPGDWKVVIPAVVPVIIVLGMACFLIGVRYGPMCPFYSPTPDPDNRTPQSSSTHESVHARNDNSPLEAAYSQLDLLQNDPRVHYARPNAHRPNGQEYNHQTQSHYDVAVPSPSELYDTPDNGYLQPISLTYISIVGDSP